MCCTESSLQSDNGRLGIQRVKNRFDHQEIDAAFDQRYGRDFERVGQLVKFDISKTWVVDIGRNRGRSVRWPQYAGDISRDASLRRMSVGALTGQTSSGRVQFGNEFFHAVIRHGRLVRVKGVGFNDVRTRFEETRVNIANDVRPSDR